MSGRSSGSVAGRRGRATSRALPVRVSVALLVALSAPAPRVVEGQVAVKGGGTSAATCVTSKCHAGLLKAPSRHAAVRKLKCSVCHPSVKDLRDPKAFAKKRGAAWGAYSPHKPRPSSSRAAGKGRPRAKAPTRRSARPAAPWTPPIPGVSPHGLYARAYCTTCHESHGSETPFMLRRGPLRLCRTCHTETGRREAWAHAPVTMGACLLCHVPHDPEYQPLLREQQPALCFNCHDDVEESLRGKHVHPPVMQACTRCHGPHGGDFKKMLPAEGKELCVRCHSSIRERIEASEVPHKALEKGCAFCHEPHASSYKRLLKLPGDAICRTCHADKVKQMEAVAFPHGAVTASGCLGCHDPHGSRYGALLKLAFPARQPYRDYKEAEYRLCFACHLTKMLDPELKPPFTRFRDGGKNLHIVHVRRKTKGRSCGLCHAPHGGPQPHILRREMPFGEMKLPYRFKQLGGGGTCQVACHGPRPYGGRTTAAAKEKARAERKRLRAEQLRKAAEQRAAAEGREAGPGK